MSGREELRRLVREEVDKLRTFDLGTVEGVRDDGTLNVRLGGQTLDGIPANVSYSPRAEGDTVLLARWRGGVRVIDRVGAPSSTSAGTKVTWGNATPNGTGWQQAASVWVRDNEVFAQLSAGDPPPGDVDEISPSTQGAWQRGYLDSGQTVSQGAWPTYPHPYTGGWFYGSQVVAAAGAGAIDSISIRLSRTSKRHGVYGAVTPRLYLLAAGSAPNATPPLGDGPVSGPALGLGVSKSFILPTSWRDALASGTAKGIGCYADVGGDYLVFTGSCGQLTLTYS